MNRAHWPTKENRKKFVSFVDFSDPWKKWPQMDPNGARRIFFLLIQTLPIFLPERIWILRIFIFVDFLDPRFLDFQVPRLPKSGLGRARLGLGQARLLGAEMVHK